MNNHKIIITGSRGFIGSNFIEKTKHKNLIFVKRNTGNSGFEMLNSSNQKVDFHKVKNNKFSILHLATFFSKNEYDNKKIYEANISFGEKLIEKTNGLDIHKILYTNTMYNFYKDSETRNLFYTETKNQFSNYLKNYTTCRDIFYEEIYLDNTFGSGDTRKKIIPLIIDAVNEDKRNPIINPNNSINLIPVSSVVERLDGSLEKSISSTSSFISKRSINISSIYDYLKNFKLTKKKQKQILLFMDNNYTSHFPEIDYSGIKIPNIENSLIETFENK